MKLIHFIPTKPIFTSNELDRLSSICADIAQVLFASTVVPFAFGIDEVLIMSVILGLESTIFSWIVSLWIARKK